MFSTVAKLLWWVLKQVSDISLYKETVSLVLIRGARNSYFLSSCLTQSALEGLKSQALQKSVQFKDYRVTYAVENHLLSCCGYAAPEGGCLLLDTVEELKYPRQGKSCVTIG